MSRCHRGSVPELAVLSEYADLFQLIVRRMPNCKMPPAKTTAAIKACHLTKALYFGAEPVDKFAD